MSLEETVDEQEINAAASAGHIAVKELTSAKRDIEKKSNIDFKTILNLPEVCSHCALEWLNVVATKKPDFKKRLQIVDLVDRMKRLRVSTEGSGRHGVEDVLKGEVQAERSGGNMFNKLFRPGGNQPG